MQATTVPTTSHDARGLIRTGKHTSYTSGLVPRHVQANLVVLPREQAFDFLLFCQRNPKPCPLLEVVEAGLVEASQVAMGSDLRTDIPKYRVYGSGELLAEPTDILDYWQDDLVSFLLGCSFSFESALVDAGIHLPHYERGGNTAMFITAVETIPAGVFSGPMVVSMRAIPREKLVKAIQVTSRFPAVHGSPVHIGDPDAIGIRDVTMPDLGEPVEFKEGDVPVFWACGVTPQAVAMKSKPPLMITHSPGHMFITDLMNEDVSVF